LPKGVPETEWRGRDYSLNKKTMDISNMILANLKGKALEEITKSVWGNNAATKAIAAKALPMLLGQLEKNSQDESQADALNKALDAHTGASKIDVADGMKIFGHLFWHDSDSTVEAVAKAAGASKEESAGVMGALSSVLMETLWDQKKAAGGFSTGDLMKLLSGTGKDVDILGMVMDQDGDGDFDKNDAMKFGMKWVKNKLLGKK
jgi:hypothetical protein